MTAAAMATALSVPAYAQFSDGYKFLEAVKKREGNDAMALLSEPGSTLVNARDITSGETAMHIVVARRDLPWIAFLMARGANPDIRDAKGVTPLELAVSLRFYDGVEALAKAGAKIDVTNATGETPLIIATHLRDEALAKMLLKRGADPDRADSSGRSARDYAARDGRKNPVLAAIEASDTEDDKSGAYGPVIN